jgi:HK97 family phage major capsid protein
MAKLVAHQAQTKDPTGMNTQTLEDGGILIPPTFSQTIFKRVFETSDILGALDTYTLSGNSIVFPRINEDSRATGSRSGGLRAYWVAEGDTVTASKMKFDRLSLALQKMMALAYVTQEQLDDGGNSLEKYLIDGISDEIQFLTLDSVIRGNGVGKPTGILNHASLITITQEAAQAAATLNANNISKMWSRLFLRSRAGANWYINQDVEPQLDLLALSIGTGGSTVPMYLPPGGLRDLPDGRLKGKAVKVIEHCETLGTVGDAILWDPGSYCFVTKGGVKTSMSMHLRFDYDEMVYKVTYRCNGMPWWPKALTPYKGTNTVGTAVVIETRAG